ncbi:MAG: PHP domain-containing protein [Candidatus Schekmanbacteria bacterium GWA2_38_9]|uniref:PHP domain-containing protein n=1 Tax=Candidatus Schekmanbacteria bacterium RIFCSPLOWO2_12_FULL_38_15 TaxID=1817883 RepID=A0A1F7SG01_9BACT|nr:MAG: PHP domain-containing protein [Candidatus Schekmanbacteria bacterium GWA2_38_9]OGL48639.1 MAG: PHP domain-containing protein [Candidatus Schekmanbacteria bacterium RIFCSPLOWO2_02_FULL_38_14]OGL52689.1 MAG: PHP domain-containing protein [Candidatus Schekmanbacteria bacterium RIFCSPLOWO2_12_FULL_38_15]
MIDLHTHSLFSDGELIPSELARRAMVMGYEAIAITDHGDFSNIEFIIPRIVDVSKELARFWKIKIIPGIELTHIPPESVKDLARKSRKLGAKIVVVHGETLVEPVQEGTNLAAINSDIDILAHPGLITEEEVLLAKERGIFLEITTRRGHSLGNGNVAKLATKTGAPVVLNTDSHSPSDLIKKDFAGRVLLASGVPENQIEKVFENSRKLIKKVS